jgi:Bacterial capsule synthesis protein PGA_cap
MSDTVVLGFTGDVCLAGAVREAAERTDRGSLFADVAPELHSVDLLIGNLECCLVDERCTAEERRAAMAVPASLATTLVQAGFHAMSLANNHIMDAGVGGLRATREQLARLGITCFGAGTDIAAAESAAVVDCHGRRVALLGASDFSMSQARGGGAGTAPMDVRRLAELVRRTRDEADLVVVSLHADLEFSDCPSPHRMHLSRRLVDQGASIVVQHHPHVPQGVEEYNGGLIAYSLGNFVFEVSGNSYLDTRPGTSDGLVLKVYASFTTSTPTLRWECVPTVIGVDHRPMLSTGAVRERQLRRLSYLSACLRDASTVRRLWRRRCAVETFDTAHQLAHALRRRQWRAIRGELNRVITRPEERRWLRGLLSLGSI